jgi:hypothetical protein
MNYAASSNLPDPRLTGIMPIDKPAQLKAMHLYGMAAIWNEWLAEEARKPVEPDIFLEKLIEAEIVDRLARSRSIS